MTMDGDVFVVRLHKLRQRQFDGGRCSFTGAALQAEVAAVQLSYLLCDRHTEPCSLLLCSIKRLEQPSKRFAVHTTSSIHYIHQNLAVAIEIRSYLNRTVWFACLHGV